ncbi:MAG: transposase [Scytonema sp. RU_4_4]|nr:transposase [Scytonema sp. RU_4_4]NJR72821.1 transposase [Scytonema sp. CRU_2_7]
MTSKVETLAKLYLQGESAEISEEAKNELCDWLMSEFQQLPINVQFSDYMRYETTQDMFADIEQGQLWESAESYDSAIYPNPFYGFAFLAIHDYDHYRTISDFSLEGEIIAYKLTAKRAPSLEIQKILYSEIVLKTATYLYLGHTPETKIIFP